ncbi:MAG TPA: P-II family nitrogen regulator [Candidatus Nitrosotenuis sp.]|nr:P-II family nitrogen regulator [Candidatus Nitrosotenuis sp.]
MIKIEAVLGKNDVMPISEALKRIKIGGLTVTKMRGRGKNPPPEIHASKGTEIFVPQFSDKYVVQVIIPETKEEEVISIIKQNATVGKIFVSPILRAIDIGSGSEGESVI